MALPISYPLKTLEELEDRSYFDSFHFPYNKSSVPLPKSVAPDRPRLLVCHDMKGGYQQDKWIQGSSEDHVYAIWHWHLIDIFVYFSHALVTIPPPCWTNAAHNHGVQVTLHVLAIFLIPSRTAFNPTCVYIPVRVCVDALAILLILCCLFLLFVYTKNYTACWHIPLCLLHKCVINPHRNDNWISPLCGLHSIFLLHPEPTCLMPPFVSQRTCPPRWDLFSLARFCYFFSCIEGTHPPIKLLDQFVLPHSLFARSLVLYVLRCKW